MCIFILLGLPAYLRCAGGGDSWGSILSYLNPSHNQIIRSKDKHQKARWKEEVEEEEEMELEDKKMEVVQEEVIAKNTARRHGSFSEFSNIVDAGMTWRIHISIFCALARAR